MQAVADRHDTPANSLLWAPGGDGGLPDVHPDPFHISARGAESPLEPTENLPTAKQKVGELHDRSDSSVLVAPAGPGTVCIVQRTPFHTSPTSLRVQYPWASVCGPHAVPSAIQNLSEAHETASKLAVAPRGLGVVWTFQPRPFQRAARVTCTLVFAVSWPTAVHAALEEHETSFSAPSPGPVTVGRFWFTHRGPRRCPANNSAIIPPRWKVPTLMHAPLTTHVTAANDPSVAPFGRPIRSTDQNRPFHRSASGRWNPALFVNDPTALHAFRDVHATSTRLVLWPPYAASCQVHIFPSQTSPNVRVSPAESTTAVPTAKHDFDDVHETLPSSEPLPPGSTAFAFDHLWPFHRWAHVAP
jgi:hypothetical protein